MEFLPPLRFGLLNGWLLLAAYFVGLVIASRLFPPDKRQKLYFEPHYPTGHPRWILLMLGRLAAITFITLMLFARLRLGTALFYLGLAVYVLGYAVVMLSLHDYMRTPAGEVVSAGLYRYSRNPQWLGLVGIFVGTAFAAGGWLHLLLVLVAAYHFQILLEEEVCAAAYGARYRDYVRRVPRYLIV